MQPLAKTMPFTTTGKKSWFIGIELQCRLHRGSLKKTSLGSWYSGVDGKRLSQYT
ncbi:hypothetical protein O9H85_09975 [Paenibacillus filicis]|uniref:Uncharacterized protein n=1 Tax=Paenibacillus gyeongsangnamensis TaxID=3388067 RepID=A0ABT4Q7H3_9BACL|nr:hypothetical protein [Paenibacillus filicis]MCZ8512736.1 hypothetical protein [Paenibacillus filicis]